MSDDERSGSGSGSGEEEEQPNQGTAANATGNVEAQMKDYKTKKSRRGEGNEQFRMPKSGQHVNTMAGGPDGKRMTAWHHLDLTKTTNMAMIAANGRYSKETITFLCPDEPTQVLYSVVQGDYPSKHHIPSAAFPKNTQALYTHCNQSTRSIPWSYEDGHTRAKKQVERCAGKSRDEKWGLVFAWLLGKTWNVGTAAFLQYKTHHDNTNDDAFLQHTIMGTSPGAARRAEAAATANVVQKATGNTAGISHYGGGSPALPMLADGRVSESSGAASPQTEIVTVVAQKDMLLYMTEGDMRCALTRLNFRAPGVDLKKMKKELHACLTILENNQQAINTATYKHNCSKSTDAGAASSGEKKPRASSSKKGSTAAAASSTGVQKSAIPEKRTTRASSAKNANKTKGSEDTSQHQGTEQNQENKGEQLLGGDGRPTFEEGAGAAAADTEVKKKRTTKPKGGGAGEKLELGPSEVQKENERLKKQLEKMKNEMSSGARENPALAGVGGSPDRFVRTRSEKRASQEGKGTEDVPMAGGEEGAPPADEKAKPKRKPRMQSAKTAAGKSASSAKNDAAAEAPKDGNGEQEDDMFAQFMAGVSGGADMSNPMAEYEGTSGGATSYKDTNIPDKETKTDQGKMKKAGGGRGRKPLPYTTVKDGKRTVEVLGEESEPEGDKWERWQDQQSSYDPEEGLPEEESSESGADNKSASEEEMSIDASAEGEEMDVGE